MSVIPTHRLDDVRETLAKPNGAVADAGRDRLLPGEPAALTAGARAQRAGRVSANGTASTDAPLSHAPEAWLVDAAASGDVWEIVVVLRGKVRHRSGHPEGLWSVRLPDGHYRVFSPDAVIAATPITKRGAAPPRRTPESGNRG